MAQYTFSRSRKNWNQIRKNILFILLALILLAVSFLFFAFKVNSFSLALRLLGQESMFLEYGDTYTEPGVELLLIGTHMFQEGLTLDSRHVSFPQMPEEDSLGKNELVYTAGIFGLEAQCSRAVTVIDSVSPVITLTVDDTKRWHVGYTATDNYDGDLTADVKCTEELGRLSFAVIDSSGNPAYIEKSVPFYDIDPPQIELTGGYRYEIGVGDSYVEPGYQAVDNADGRMTDQVLVEGEVNCFVPGVYPITYTAIDSVDNEAKIIRNVEVVAKPRPEVREPGYKTVYLTFDDGPSPYTRKLLEILDKYNVKATFFVTDSENTDFMKKIVEHGHSIGIHSVDHDYASIYASPEAFFADLRAMQNVILEQTGVTTTLMRFPGGSSNTVSRNTYEGLMTLLTQAVQDAGYQYFDWNVDSMDASTARTSNAVYQNVIQGIAREGSAAIVLQHDIHEYSVDAVEKIILWCFEHGYSFEALNQNSPGFHHPLRN